MNRKPKGYTISTVAGMYNVHEQTLRLYEREGLIKPSRSSGNTRYYTDEDLLRLEVILNLTRDMGVNLAGIEIILNMREKMDEMRREFLRFFEYVSQHLSQDPIRDSDQFKNALVRVRPPQVPIVQTEVTIVKEPKPRRKTSTR
jgi:MerR family transcriptional regulator/heat shock protein HspR